MTQTSLRVLVFGDIFGRLGRSLVHTHLEALKRQYSPDMIIGNSENLTGGKAASVEHIREFESMGFDCLTGGNHSLSRLSETTEELDRDGTIQIRPANYYEHPQYRIPGKGYRIIAKDGKKVLVVNLMANAFMRDEVYNPFLKIDEILASFDGEKFDAIFVDFHRETTAELYCMAEYLSGRATFVYGTHTHVQTNDEHILESGTGMICDIGMTGPLHSSIGQGFEGRIANFASGVGVFWGRPEAVTEGLGSLHAALVTIQDGKCIGIEKIRIRDGE